MQKLTRITALACTVLLASCGQARISPTASTPFTAASVISTTVTSTADAETEARKAYLQANPTPPEAVVQGSVTDLSQTLPANKALSPQSIDKSVPIILVSGLTGFGREDLHGVIKYWGGTFDVQEDLKSLGYQVHTAKIGPFSSNWARAAELYAQIKGGCVDYGAARAAQYGHDRFDPVKCYKGFYPQWDAQHPVNLVGHSMGGLTSRMLVRLLEDGSPENADGDNLFSGGRTGWVKNVMTISTPNSGSSAADNQSVVLPMFRGLTIALVSADTIGGNDVYDFYLGQYHLTQQPSESFISYLDRTLTLIYNTKDSGVYDLTVDGAKELNDFIGRSKVTKYFSWSTKASNAGLLTGWNYPDATMNSFLATASYPYPRPLEPGVGNIYDTSPRGAVTYDSSWWPNDGLVSSNYANEPIGQQGENYTGQATQPGHWYRLGLLNGYDHIDITGNLTLRDVRPFYRNQAAFLSSQN